MPNSLELVERLLKNETANRTLYNQLIDSLDDPRYIRVAENLETLQTRQISMLNRLLSVLEEEAPPPPRDRYYAEHILQPGETLRVLAIKYNTTVSRIRALNPGLGDNPQAGQVITLPIEIPKPPPRHIEYYVRPGDSLYTISQRYNTDIDTLVRLNNIADPEVIFPGRILIIPRT
ncbi:peptidoglycan-binding protein LysM [Orenia metallireducens]|jgi:LysM repeat protein|uniref:Peptidoglycan-binding protein LysM n=1 Tax=Orenia metallireducens TaxID=1413210 RepID=A0A1C0ACL8_9FIRM|nr:LysM peptidoglycan-binding domain-containing protein [Orenia metallireducens]OCL28106.1 peptidoglycan-binding protein LysM [Orenia metallireducens]